MLGKLMKHELIATGRKYGMFYLVLAMVTLFTGLIRCIRIESVLVQGLQSLVMILYFMALIGVLFCSIGFAVIRFYKNMVSEEGYLTFTLPAKVEELVAAKLAVAFIWQIVTALLCIASVFGIFRKGSGSKLLTAGTELFKTLLRENGRIVAVVLVFLLVCLLYQILLYYLSIAIGQLFSGNKVLGAVVGYCILNFALQIVLVVITCIFGAIIGFEKLDAYANSENGIVVFLALEGGFMLCVAGAFFVTTCHLLKKKLNLT